MGWVGGGGGGRVGNVQGLTQSIKAESNYDCDVETPQRGRTCSYMNWPHTNVVVTLPEETELIQRPYLPNSSRRLIGYNLWS